MVQCSYSSIFRTPSHMLTDQLRGEAQKHQGNLDHARKSDRFIASKLESGAEFLQRLSWEKEQISGLLPTADLLSGTTPTLNVSVLKERLSQLDTLLFEREQKLTQLKELSTKVRSDFGSDFLIIYQCYTRTIFSIKSFAHPKTNSKRCSIKSCKSIRIWRPRSAALSLLKQACSLISL